MMEASAFRVEELKVQSVLVFVKLRERERQNVGKLSFKLYIYEQKMV